MMMYMITVFCVERLVIYVVDELLKCYVLHSHISMKTFWERAMAWLESLEHYTILTDIENARDPRQNDGFHQDFLTLDYLNMTC